MLRHLMQKLLGSLTGHKHGHYGHGHGHGYKQFSSSAYKKGQYYPPPAQPHHYSSSDYKKGHYHPPHNPHYGHGHYKKKHGSFSS